MAQAIHNWQMDQNVGGNSQPETKPKYTSAFQTLFQYTRPHLWGLLGVVAFSFIAILSDLLQPYLMKLAIDDHLLAGMSDYKGLIRICAIYFVLSALSFVFTYLQSNLLQYIGQSIVGRIRKQLFSHILRQSMRYFDRMSSGSLITHISSDTEALNQLFNQVLLSLFRDGLTLILIMVLMFQLDTQLAMYCLILLPIIAGIAIAFRSFMRTTYQLARTRLSRMVAFVAENLAGMNLVQSFHQEKEQIRQFKERNGLYFQANVREIRTNVLFNRTFDLLSNLSIAFVTWLGGRAVLGDHLEFGVLYAFITYIRQFFQPINTITQQWNTLQSATVSLTRIHSVFAETAEIQDVHVSTPVQNKPVKGDVDFDHITFAYEPGSPVIRNLSLFIPAGHFIGVVGTTGAGKSSLISLLCRFYDVQEGTIRIDDNDIRHIPQDQLHRIVGLVQQEPFLYSGSIIDNIRLFDEAITREEVITACEFVGAHTVIQKLQHGYDTRLSERGSGLSAGERQLISFARIIVFKPNILILDEASANLDSQTEQLIQHALHAVARNRTTIVIAHRLSTIMQADRILVMKKGEIVEQGTHEQLIQQQGHYRKLYEHSMGPLVNPN